MDWQEGENSGMAKSSDQLSLFLTSCGPKRKTSKTPAVIIVHGLGGSYLEWVPAMKLLSRSARVYLFERAGYHPSQKSSQPRTPSNIVAELKAMLSLQGIEPPYILIGHSYGGILVRQFLADYGADEIAGMVIVDSVLDMDPDFPKDWTTFLGDASYESVVGIEASHCFPTTEDFQAVVQTSARNEGPGSIAEEEFENRKAQELIAQLRGRQALGNKPLSVIFCNTARDFRKIYEHGMKYGHGSPEAQEALRKYLGRMSQSDEAAMRTHLDLSSNNRFIKATGKAETHNCQMTEPDLVVEEVEWVLQQCKLV